MLIGNFSATDCINGTIYDSDLMPDNYLNFTNFWDLQRKWRDVIDKDQKFLPMQDNLTVSYDAHLYINLEGCVNTLRGECRQFHASHGRDGKDNTAPSRFHCFYNKVYNFSFFNQRIDMYRDRRNCITNC